MYKVGDRVRIRRELPVGYTYNLFIPTGMVKYVGVETSVAQVIYDKLLGELYKLECDLGYYTWNADTIEPVMEHNGEDLYKVWEENGGG